MTIRSPDSGSKNVEKKIFRVGVPLPSAIGRGTSSIFYDDTSHKKHV